jgi:long-chain acyl-CoA synthetase
MSYRSLPEYFFKVCSDIPDKDIFLVKKDGVYQGVTHAEIVEQVNSLALGLLELGIRKNDRVGIVSENRIEWAAVYMAIISIGATAVPVFPSSSSKQEEYIFDNCGATAVVVSNNFQLHKIMDFKDRLENLRHVLVMNDDFNCEDFAVRPLSAIKSRGEALKAKNERYNSLKDKTSKIEPNDLATLIYTSGTTGNPKGVMLTHLNMVSDIIGAIEATGIVPEDILLSYLPWCHAYELTTGLFTAICTGSTVALADSVESVGLNLMEVRPTFLTTVPRLLEMIMKRMKKSMEREPESKRKMFNWAIETGKKYVEATTYSKPGIALKAKHSIADKFVYSKIREKTGGRLKKIVSGGAPLSAETAIFFMAAGFTVMEGYGLTEAAPVVAVTRQNNIELGAIGMPLYNVEVKLSEDGELLVRGPNVMKGYWNDPQATMEAIDEEGWLYTGDIAIITEKGNIKITDRKKNIFVNSGGKNIAPQPIETVLSQSPFIEHVVLLGDNREYVSALITPDFAQLKVLAESLEIKYSNLDELISNPRVIQAIKNDIDRLQKDFAKFERVRKFRLLSQPFSIESGELTPKLSIRRHVVERNYSVVIDEMYNVN